MPENKEVEKCSQCGTQLEPTKEGKKREPCPKCGGISRTISVVIEESLNFATKLDGE